MAGKMQQWPSAVLVLLPCNTVPHVVASNQNIILLLLHDYNSATVTDCNRNV